jgi:hypothetical protein
MSDNSRNAGPAGQPRATAPSSGPLSPPRSLPDQSDEDPTSFVRGPTPWPAPGESHVHGPLSTDRVDEYVSRVFRPPDPVAKEIELRLERIRQKRDRYRLKRAIKQLARDQTELEELAGQLERLRQPQAQPEPPLRPGRPTVISGDVETLRTLRAEHPGSPCRGEFIATLPKDLQKRQKAKRYHDADKALRETCDKKR